MSLITIQEIGRKIRNELSKKESLLYHRFVKRAPIYDEKQPYSYFIIDVNDSFQIDINSLRETYDESLIKDKFFYLKYKTGEADSLVKYLYGDIVYPDYFRLDDPTNGAASFRVNSFIRGKEDARKIESTILITFRNSLETHLPQILQLLKEKEFCYINFNFQGKHWYETDVFEVVESSIVSNFIKIEADKISLKAFLTRTLIESEERLPDFLVSNTYKAKLFNNIEEVKDLLYGLDFQQKSKINVGKEIMINMLPKGKLGARGIISYYDKRSIFDYKNPTENQIDPFTEPFFNPDIDGIEKYDIVFSKRTKPIGVDLLEMTDVNQNLLQRVSAKIQKVKQELDYRYPLDYSIKSLLDDKKYTSHLLKILPLIYKDNYYQDPVLLPALIQKTEFGIRNGDKSISFNLLKSHFYFLSKLQINNVIMEIKETKSYQLGTKLGIMSKPVAQAIKSFEKSYVGNLSRRISSIDNVIEFANYLNEKLMIHEKGYPSVKVASKELTDLLDNFPTKEKYNRNYCALGFFESYYTFYKQENNTETA